MSHLNLIKSKGVLTVRLARADVRNALSKSMIQEIQQVFQDLQKDSDLRVVVLEGEGSVFCAGADLQDMKKMAQFSFAENQQDATELHQMFTAIWDCPVPVVCRVHGAVYGGALGLVAVSDFVVAAEQTKFCFSEVRLGLAPAVISDFLSRTISSRALLPYMMSGQVFTEIEALQMGLIHKVRADSSGEVLQFVSAQLEAGPEASRVTKKMIRALPALETSARRGFVSQTLAERRSSAEGQEGLLAFFEKRPPIWRKK